MKWQGYSEKAVDRVNKLWISVTNNRKLMVIAVVAIAIIALTSSFKWTGGRGGGGG
jgi:hypothetical protein